MLRIADMGDGHLTNTIRMLERRFDEAIQRMLREGPGGLWEEFNELVEERTRRQIRRLTDD